jgi:hypothetical protein
MSIFCPDQGRTRVSGKAYSLYAAAENPRRTQIRAKRAIYGWKLKQGIDKGSNGTTFGKNYQRTKKKEHEDNGK